MSTHPMTDLYPSVPLPTQPMVSSMTSFKKLVRCGPDAMFAANELIGSFPPSALELTGEAWDQAVEAHIKTHHSTLFQGTSTPETVLEVLGILSEEVISVSRGVIVCGLERVLGRLIKENAPLFPEETVAAATKEMGDLAAHLAEAYPNGASEEETRAFVAKQISEETIRSIRRYSAARVRLLPQVLIDIPHRALAEIYYNAVADRIEALRQTGKGPGADLVKEVVSGVFDGIAEAAQAKVPFLAPLSEETLVAFTKEMADLGDQLAEAFPDGASEEKFAAFIGSRISKDTIRKYSKVNLPSLLVDGLRLLEKKTGVSVGKELMSSLAEAVIGTQKAKFPFLASLLDDLREQVIQGLKTSQDAAPRPTFKPKYTEETMPTPASHKGEPKPFDDIITSIGRLLTASSEPEALRECQTISTFLRSWINNYGGLTAVNSSAQPSQDSAPLPTFKPKYAEETTPAPPPPIDSIIASIGRVLATSSEAETLEEWNTITTFLRAWVKKYGGLMGVIVGQVIDLITREQVLVYAKTLRELVATWSESAQENGSSLDQLNAVVRRIVRDASLFDEVEILLMGAWDYAESQGLTLDQWKAALCDGLTKKEAKRIRKWVGRSLSSLDGPCPCASNCACTPCLCAQQPSPRPFIADHFTPYALRKAEDFTNAVFMDQDILPAAVDAAWLARHPTLTPEQVRDVIALYLSYHC